MGPSIKGLRQVNGLDKTKMALRKYERKYINPIRSSRYTADRL